VTVDVQKGRGIIISDTHFDATKEEHNSYKLVKKFAKAWKPDFVVNLGDWIDLPYLSSFDEGKIKTLSGKAFRGDFDLAKSDLDYWQKVTKNYYLLQGNHDERVDRVIDRRPELDGFIDYESVFDFKERGIKYISVLDQPLKLGKLHFLHGWYTNKYHCNKHLEVLAGNCVYGHVHKNQSNAKRLPAMGIEIQAWSLGCLNDVQPEWLKGRPSSWQHSFGIVYMEENGNFNFYPINIVDDSFIWEGKRWHL